MLGVLVLCHFMSAFVGPLTEPEQTHRHLVSAVPVRQLQDDAGEHAGLEQAEEESGDVEAVLGGDGGVASEGNAPGELSRQDEVSDCTSFSFLICWSDDDVP